MSYPGNSSTPNKKLPSRLTTIVWGVILIALGAAAIALSLGATIDTQLGLIALLGVTGVLLVGVSLYRTLRKKNTPTGTSTTHP